MLHFNKPLLTRLFYLYTLGIILISVLPINDSKSPSTSINDHYILRIRLDYLLHAALFIPWVILRSLSKELSFTKSPVKSMIRVAVFLIFAATMELVQYFLPNRTFNVTDLAFNFIGVLIGMLLSLMPKMVLVKAGDLLNIVKKRLKFVQ